MPDISTAGELVDYLAAMPRDMKIVLSKDADGNGYSPLADAEEAMYQADSAWSGDVWLLPERLAELIASEAGWSEDDGAPGDAERVIVLGPVN